MATVKHALSGKTLARMRLQRDSGGHGKRSELRAVLYRREKVSFDASNGEGTALIETRRRTSSVRRRRSAEECRRRRRTSSPAIFSWKPGLHSAKDRAATDQPRW